MWEDFGGSGVLYRNVLYCDGESKAERGRARRVLYARLYGHLTVSPLIKRISDNLAERSGQLTFRRCESSRVSTSIEFGMMMASV